MTEPKVEQRDRPPVAKCRCWKPSQPQIDCPVHGPDVRRRQERTG